MVRPASYQDILDAPDGMVAELIGGVLHLHLHPRPASPHGRAASGLGAELWMAFDQGRTGPGGWWILDEPEIHFSDGDVFVPGLAGWRRETMPRFEVAAHHRTVPDWACEVLSPRSREYDVTEKRAVYGRRGVGHLWFVDPDARTLEGFRLEARSWRLIGAAHGDARGPNGPLRGHRDPAGHALGTGRLSWRRSADPLPRRLSVYPPARPPSRPPSRRRAGWPDGPEAAPGAEGAAESSAAPREARCATGVGLAAAMGSRRGGGAVLLLGPRPREAARRAPDCRITPMDRLRPASGTLLALAALGLALASIWQLERARAGVVIEQVMIGTTPATLYRPRVPGAPVAVVAHGFSGSRQMMEAFSLTLARSGIAALAYDLRGHGRNPVPMTGEVASLDGVTAGLVEEARAVMASARTLDGVGPPVALLGHSMATDVIVRAAEAEGIGAAVAVSMHSEAVSATRPERLLVISGAREGRLREAALAAARRVDPAAEEGETVRAGAVVRRAVAAPWVGHVGVLWSPAALGEARDWIAAAAARPLGGPVARTGPWIAALLGAVVALAWPLARLLPARGAAGPEAPLGAGRLALALALPALAAAAAALAVPSAVPTAVIGLRGADGLAAFLLVLGAGQLALLRRWGLRPGRPDAPGSAALLAWAAVFALALDRYGASFVPTGPRWALGALLLPGAVLTALADGVLCRGASLGRAVLVRAVPLAALLAAMLAAPERLGLQFTALPVWALFWAVFGTMARRVAARRGRDAPRAALGLALAWSLAASLPLFG